jgi:hypothetical protein
LISQVLHNVFKDAAKGLWILYLTAAARGMKVHLVYGKVGDAIDLQNMHSAISMSTPERLQTFSLQIGFVVHPKMTAGMDQWKMFIYPMKKSVA